MPRLARIDAPGVLHHVMSDERNLGESDFVETVLSEANESYEHRYKLKRLGYD